jgi:hypothetical protein
VKIYPQLGLTLHWRRAAREAAAPYRKHYGDQRPAVGEQVEPLLPVKVLDADLHRRLLAAIAVLDLACAYQRPHRITAAGKRLVAVWREVTAAIEARRPLQEEEGLGHGSVVEPPHSAGREGATALRGGTLPRI